MITYDLVRKTVKQYLWKRILYVCTWYAAVAVPNKKPSGKLARLSLVDGGQTGPSAVAGETMMVRSKSSPTRGNFIKTILLLVVCVFSSTEEV